MSAPSHPQVPGEAQLHLLLVARRQQLRLLGRVPDLCSSRARASQPGGLRICISGLGIRHPDRLIPDDSDSVWAALAEEQAAHTAARLLQQSLIREGKATVGQETHGEPPQFSVTRTRKAQTYPTSRHEA